MTIHLILSMLWMLIGIAFFRLIRNRYRSLGSLKATSNRSGRLPCITVIVPARNEELNIEACVQGLLAQEYPSSLLKIFVVDDHSVDQTAAIVQGLSRANPQIDLLRAPPLPIGWHGKQHACWYAAVQADSDWLCFIDADTRQAPGLLQAAVNSALESKLDLLSLHPRQEMKTFWERLLMPIPLITLMILMDARRINDPTHSSALTNGQFILLRADVYRAVDGHRSVREAVLDDVELGKRVKQNGYRIAIRGGGDFIRNRMYRDLTTLWNGLARNGSELFGPKLTAIAVFNAFFVAIMPWLYPLWLFTQMGERGSIVTLAALLAALTGSVGWYGFHVLALNIHAVPLYYLPLIPVSNLLIGVVNLNGLFQRARGRRTWKGRQI